MRLQVLGPRLSIAHYQRMIPSLFWDSRPCLCSVRLCMTWRRLVKVSGSCTDNACIYIVLCCEDWCSHAWYSVCSKLWEHMFLLHMAMHLAWLKLVGESIDTLMYWHLYILPLWPVHNNILLNSHHNSPMHSKYMQSACYRWSSHI